MFNTEYSVGIVETTDILTAMFADSIANQSKPQTAFIHGSMGLGKSASIKGLADKLADKLKRVVVVIDLRLGAMDESAIQGIPYTAQKSEEEFYKDMFFSTPQWWPENDDVLYILFLDELSNALKPQQQAAYRLVLDGEIHNGSRLGNNVMIVAAGNTKLDGTGAKDILPALANRFDIHLYIDDIKAGKDFLYWGVNSGIHRDVISYLNWKNESIVTKPVTDAFARPRTWESVSKHLKNKFFTPRQLEISIVGAVGADVGTDFLIYREFNIHLPKWDKLREGDTSFIVPNDQMIQWAIATPVAFELINGLKADDSVYINSLCEVIRQLSDELKIIVFRTMKFDMTNAFKMFNYPAIMKQYEPVKQALK